MSDAGRRLEAHMSALCEAAWGRPWVDHLEYSLWHALVQGPMAFGRIRLEEADLRELRALADACGGWIRSDGAGGVELLPLAAWQDAYTAKVDLVRMDAPMPPAGPLG